MVCVKLNAMSETRQLCTFTLDRLLCGIDVSRVREVFRLREITPIPLAPDEVSGLLNLRGQIVTAIDLRRRLGLSEREGNDLPMSVVVYSPEGNISFLVDGVGDVLDLRDEDFELPPESIDDSVSEMLEGVYKLEGSLLHVLRVDNLLDIRMGEPK